MSRRIYVASSWRNAVQPSVVAALRECGHDVYDFRHPNPGDDGFHLSEIDPNYRAWSAREYRTALAHPLSDSGFKSDFDAMRWADTGVLVLPCGRSAHLEAGYFVGAGKPLYILLADENEPELMYKMATAIHIDFTGLIDSLAEPAP